jgi:hypothetical protein
VFRVNAGGMNCPLRDTIVFLKAGLPGDFVSRGVTLGSSHGLVDLALSGIEALALHECHPGWGDDSGKNAENNNDN